MPDHPGPLAGIREALERLLDDCTSSKHPNLLYKPTWTTVQQARAALASLDSMKGEVRNLLVDHLYSDVDRERIETIQTKIPRPWQRVLVIPMPEEVQRG